MRQAADMPWATVSRRGLLQAGTGGALALLLERAFVLDALAQEGDAAERGYAFFNREDAQTMQAIVARIWPTTDTPGAHEMGAVDYIDRAMIGAYERLEVNYQRGLSQLDAASRDMHDAPFRNLSEEQQDDILSRLEAGDLPHFAEGEASDFFTLVHRHTMEGVFADPIYGGNRDFAGWRAVGYPGPFYLISAEAQQSFEPLDLPINSIVDL